MDGSSSKPSTRQSHASEVSVDKKKLRNRLSQQAFRKRQNAHIQELERRLEMCGKTDNERIVELEEENRHLREQLLDFHNKLHSARLSLATLSESMENTLNASSTPLPRPPDKCLGDEPTGNLTLSPQSLATTSSVHHKVQPSTGQLHFSPTVQDFSSIDSLFLDDCGLFMEQCHNSYDAETQYLEQTTSSNSCSSSASRSGPKYDPAVWYSARHASDAVQGLQSWGEPSTTTSFLSKLPNQQPLSGVPGVWSLNYQMGPSAYQNAIYMTLADLSENSHRLKTSNSRFSDHIFGMRRAISNKWQQTQPSINAEVERKRLHVTMSVMLSLFNSIARPSVLSWYTSTKFYHHIANLAMWQLDPSRQNYTQVHTRYRPSALQLTEIYPPIIDWCPFSSIRDRLILSHSGNPFIDDIICDMATAYVVETELSEIVKLDNHSPGYVRVWDLIQAMGDDDEGTVFRTPFQRGHGTDISDNSGTLRFKSSLSHFSGQDMTLPAPSTKDLFDNKDYARLVFKFLRMDRGISLFKLDPAFFSKYPELYDPDANIIASGVRLAPECQTKIQGASVFDLSMGRIYNHVAEWSLGVICKNFL